MTLAKSLPFSGPQRSPLPEEQLGSEPLRPGHRDRPLSWPVPCSQNSWQKDPRESTGPRQALANPLVPLRPASSATPSRVRCGEAWEAEGVGW